jgi:hypothetical protein
LGPDRRPRVEKFHSPDVDWTSDTFGSPITSRVTFSLRERISGSSSTPILIERASRKAPLLYAGSSEIERLSALTAPERSLRRRSPSRTSRPSASPKRDSRVGRKVFASTRNESATARRTMAATMEPAMRMSFLIRLFLPSVTATRKL